MFSPVASIGRSPALMPPLVMLAEIVARLSRGMRSLMPPFVQSSFTPPSGIFDTSISSPPFVVLACTYGLRDLWEARIGENQVRSLAPLAVILVLAFYPQFALRRSEPTVVAPYTTYLLAQR